MGDWILYADAGGGGRDVAGTALQASASALDQIARAKDVQTVLGGIVVLLVLAIAVLGWRLLVQARESSAHAVRVEGLADKVESIADDVVNRVLATLGPKVEVTATQVGELRVEVRDALGRYVGFTERAVTALERRAGGGS